MREIPDDILYDQRLIERHVAQGLITQKQVDEHLKGLRDVAEHSDVIDLDNLQNPSKSAANDTPTTDA